jgi:hypothetical protein
MSVEATRNGKKSPLQWVSSIILWDFMARYNVLFTFGLLAANSIATDRVADGLEPANISLAAANSKHKQHDCSCGTKSSITLAITNEDTTTYSLPGSYCDKQPNITAGAHWFPYEPTSADSSSYYHAHNYASTNWSTISKSLSFHTAVHFSVCGAHFFKRTFSHYSF